MDKTVFSNGLEITESINFEGVMRYMLYIGSDDSITLTEDEFKDMLNTLNAYAAERGWKTGYLK